MGVNESVFLIGIGQYFLVITIPIPKENSVGTFLVSKRGQLPPFFLKRGAMALFLRSPAPLSRKKGGTIQKGGKDTNRNTNTKPICDQINTNTKKMIGTTVLSPIFYQSSIFQIILLALSRGGW
jgi:hypothetical protein